MRIHPIALILFLASASRADPYLPYSTRAIPYVGYSTSVSGDIRTVGMSGATVGLGDTFIASMDNPSGLAMTLRTGDTHLTSNEIHDENVQSFKSGIYRNSLGAAVSIYPWGFGLGAATLHREEDHYFFTGASTGPSRLNVSVREYRASVGRSLLSDRLALGASFRFGVASEDAHMVPTDVEDQDSSFDVGYTLGAMVRLPERLLLGAAYSSPMDYGFESRGSSVAPAGFFQPVFTPSRLSWGLGWVPNRIFRADFTTHLVFRNNRAALLRSESEIVGDKNTLQPRFGAAYTYMDFRNLTGTFFGGSHYEVSRIRSRASRLHFTAGTEVKVWVMNLGLGVDRATEYKNFQASIGIDAFKVMAKLDLIPEVQGHERGFFPWPFDMDSSGLPRPLVDNWQPTEPQIDPIKTGLQIPEKIGDKIEGVTEEGGAKGVLDTIRSIPKQVEKEIEHMKEVEKNGNASGQ